MKTTSLQTNVLEYESISELDREAQDLVQSATKALEGSYAPYSKFKVGAAVLLSDGKVVTGANQENAAYPSGLCAERVALFAAGAANPGKAIVAIAVVVHSDDKEVPASAPCGACRQVMAEHESVAGKKIRIIMAGSKGPVLVISSVEELLPLMFKPESLR
jgi:cytidine deaminase